MKQLAFMIGMTLFGTAGVYLISPFCGVYVYYYFAVLRPQYMWKWSLPQEELNWSLYVALATMIATVGALLGSFKIDPGPGDTDTPPPRFCGAHKAVLAFGCWILITCLTAQHFDVAWLWFIEYLKIFIMYAVSAYVIRSVRQVWRLTVMIAVVLGYIAYEINYLYFVNNYLGIFHNGYGGLDNNGAGLMLAMGAPVCWYAYEGTNRWWRWGYLLLIPTIVHAVLMTYSRGAMLSLIVMCPWLWWRSRQKFRLTIALGCFVLLAIPMMAGAEISARFLTLSDTEIDESANSRKGSWKAAWDIAKDYPVFGVGVRNSNLFSAAYGADMVGRTIHSQYFQILADNGFIGLALYLLMLVTSWVSLRRCRRFVAGRKDPDAQIIAASASGIECSLVLYSFGSLFLSLEVFELPYLLFLISAQLQVTAIGTSHGDPIAEARVSGPATSYGSSPAAMVR